MNVRRVRQLSGFGDSGYPVIELWTFWGFGADDDARDICWTRYITRTLVPYMFVAGLNKHDYARGKLLSTTNSNTGKMVLYTVNLFWYEV